jgi:potassium-transporting ATPase ATP-binding subunit
MFKFMSARQSSIAQVKPKASAQAIDTSKSSLLPQVTNSLQHTPSAKSSASSQSPPPAFKKDEIVTVTEGDIIPFDGKILEGVALVDESALVGVSTPALLSDEDGRNNVLGGTLVVEGTLKIQRV